MNEEKYDEILKIFKNYKNKNRKKVKLKPGEKFKKMEKQKLKHEKRIN